MKRFIWDGQPRMLEDVFQSIGMERVDSYERTLTTASLYKKERAGETLEAIAILPEFETTQTDRVVVYSAEGPESAEVEKLFIARKREEAAATLETLVDYERDEARRSGKDALDTTVAVVLEYARLLKQLEDDGLDLGFTDKLEEVLSYED